MVVGEVTKQPSETFPVAVDFSAELAVGETVTGGSVAARNRATGATTTGTICAGAAAIASPTITQKLAAAGQHGDAHVLTFTANTSVGNVFEHEVVLTIREV